MTVFLSWKKSFLLLFIVIFPTCYILLEEHEFNFFTITYTNINNKTHRREEFETDLNTENMIKENVSSFSQEKHLRLEYAKKSTGNVLTGIAHQNVSEKSAYFNLASEYNLTANVTSESYTYVNDTGHIVINITLNNTLHEKQSSENPQSVRVSRPMFNICDLRDIKPSEANVIFIESRCATAKGMQETVAKGMQETVAKGTPSPKLVLSARQSCAIESVARTNPRRRIYVVHTCPLGVLESEEEAPRYSRGLALPNIYLVRYNESELFAGTPVEGLMARHGLEGSNYPVEHASDIMRLTLLWRFGGTYLDTDIIAIRSLDQLGTNFCAVESEGVIGNSVLNFAQTGRGHDILTRALQHIDQHFDGEGWTSNGNLLLTNLILEECKTGAKTLTNCSVFSVFPESVVYPVAWWDYSLLFDPTKGTDLVQHIKQTSFLVHMWNKLSHDSAVHLGSSQAYSLLAHEHCPAVYANSDDII